MMKRESLSERTEPGRYLFYPQHMFVEGVAALAVFLAIVVLSLVWQAPLEEMADPGDVTYVPRPEWYFLFYFQLLKYFEGSLAVVGTFVLPLLALTGLFLLPFLDRSENAGIGKRPLAAGACLASVAFVVALTVASVREDTANQFRMALPPVTQEQMAEGAEIFSRFCQLCHTMDGKGGFIAPDLTQVGSRANRVYIERVILDPNIVSKTTVMSLVPLSDAERHAVSAYLSRKK